MDSTVNTKTSKFLDLAKINAKIKSLKYTQDDLAKRLGISVSTVNRKLSGKREITIDDLVYLSRLLNLPITELIKTEQRGN